jgi:hypothetical protein
MQAPPSRSSDTLRANRPARLIDGRDGHMVVPPVRRAPVRRAPFVVPVETVLPLGCPGKSRWPDTPVPA